MKIKRRNFLLEIIIGILVVYSSVLIVLFIFQRNLMYHPDENNYFGDKLEVSIEKVKIKTSDNIDLLSWFHKKDLKKFKTIIYFHGNAGTLENRIHKLNHFKDININFLIVSWRGFSGNKGKPTEEGLYKDARAAKYWLNLNNISDQDIIVYGESLGTAVAIDLAKDHKFAGVILESPFTSMIKLSGKYYPWAPTRLLLKDKYETDKKIKKVFSPLLVLHGRKDNIVPFEMGEQIFKLANNPKYNYFIDNDDHMMDFNEKLINSINSFILSLK